MKIKIVCFGAIDLLELDEDGSVEVPDNATIKQALRALPLDKKIRKHIPVMVDGKLQQRSYRLEEGDELVLVVPTPGG
jgi:sulfur carrier protein ThiS